MTEMLERAARALCETDDGGITDIIFSVQEHDGDCTNQPYTCPVCQAEHYTVLARAVLEALRDPTGAVKVAGANALANLEFPPATPQHIVSAEACFQAMIDSILRTAGRASDG